MRLVQLSGLHDQGRTQGVVGVTPPLELDILQKLYSLLMGD